MYEVLFHKRMKIGDRWAKEIMFEAKEVLTHYQAVEIWEIASPRNQNIISDRLHVVGKLLKDKSIVFRVWFHTKRNLPNQLTFQEMKTHKDYPTGRRDFPQFLW